jgi:hypothetical protein
MESPQWRRGPRVGVHWLISGASLENQQRAGAYSKNRGGQNDRERFPHLLATQGAPISVRCDMSAAGPPPP